MINEENNKFENFVRNLKVLIVEDTEISLLSLKAILSRIFNEVLTAENGELGLESFKTNMPDIVVTDILMPKLNGIDMAKEIKAINSNTPIIFLSASSESEYLLKCIELGAEDYIIKPIDQNKIKRAIDKSAKRIYFDYTNRDDKIRELKELVLLSKNELLKDIAHHWRNPLNVIATNLDVAEISIEDTISKKEASKDFTQDLSNAIHSISVAQDRVQYLSKIISSFHNIFSKSNMLVDLKSTLDNSIIIASQLCKSSNIPLNFSMEGDLKYRGDFQELKIVIYELVKNSIESIESIGSQKRRDEAKIDLNFYAKEDRFYIECIDNGYGIDLKVFDKIKNPYISTKVKPYGQGLGLFIANRIMNEKFNGKLEWENLSSGARFRAIIDVVC